MRPVRELPTGTVTFLFSDIEGSTKLIHSLGPDQYAPVLAEHRRVMREAFEARGGVEVGTEGDSFFVAFPSAAGAVEAARLVTERFAPGTVRVRIGLHTGTPLMTDEGYVGIDIHLAARIAAAGHGGQVLVSAATAGMVGTDGMRDLGEHRLKDFDQPVTIYQLGDERFAPLKTISNTNLPRPASSFVGRETEVAEVAALVQDDARLLTLTGPGGSGKTRLAIEAATTVVSEFRAGVFWVDLAPIRDAGLVADTIGQVVGAQDGLGEHIGEREMLLVIDNLEQVVDAAPSLANLVETCPNLRLLATSRERLRVRGEVEYPVAPLADPDAVALFCARAQVEPDDAVGALCRALDNLPLALELAAARASVLTPAQILDRLSGRLDLLKGGRDADPRQQTLRATIEWSHELLTGAEQRLFARLGVFVGGWTLEAAEDVARAELDDLQSLADKSLMRRAGDRFLMLETIREYAAERLDASGDASELRDRHAAYFLELAETAHPHLRDEEYGGGGRAWIDRHARELDNFRAALDHFEGGGDSQFVLRMAGALAALWANSGQFVEGRRRLGQALAVDKTPTAARGRALDAASEMASFTEDLDAARSWAEEAILIFRSLGDQWGVADSTMSLAVATGEGGDWQRALPLFEESVELFREVGDERRVMWGTRSLAWAHAELGDRAGAKLFYEDALRQASAAGNRLFESVVLGSLSWLALREGRVQDAAALARDSLRLKREVGDPIESAVGLLHAAQNLATTGDAITAALLIGAYDGQAEEIGGSEVWVTRMRDDGLAKVASALGPEEVESALREGRKLTAEKALTVALDALEEVH
jgi:predicted ATPase/class 3 adenylate cyclase